jgi:phenylacetate-CoA ligase
LLEYQAKRLRALLNHCGAHVPYYRDLFRRVRFDPAAFADLDELRRLPFLDKELVRSNVDKLLADNIPPKKLHLFSTGGTSGEPLSVWNFADSGARERAFIYAVWRRVGFRPDDRRAILRGIPVHDPPHWRYDAEERATVYSNMYLRSDNAGAFARAMIDNGDRYLHSYPSSLTIFASYLEQHGIEPPRFEALLTSSENMSPAQRQRIESFYGCRAFEWYGHSENLILAAQCEHSDLYHVVPEYGVAEVVTPDGDLAGEGVEGELVGTTLWNYAMPLIRYRTGDWATAGPATPCACGRSHDLLQAIHGRRANEVVVGRNGNLIPLTALDPYTPSFSRVVRIQFRQQEPGVVELCVVRGAGYTDADTNSILSSIRLLLGSSLDVQVTFPDHVPLTEAGKHRLLVQELQIPG